MEELNVAVVQTAGKIECNFDEIKEALKVQMEAYNSLTVTEDEIPIYKKDLAVLRKIRKAVDDKRKAVKTEFEKPYDEFKAKVDELLAEIDKPISTIDTQLKMFEEDRIAAKRERVAVLYEEQVGELIEFLPIDKYYNSKWDNKSTSDNDIKFDISELTTKIKSDLDVIRSLSSEIEPELIDVYKANGNDLAAAIKRNSQYTADKAKIQAQAKEEEKKPQPEMMGALDEVVQAFKTVKIVISAEDKEEVQTILDFNGIKYQVLEG